MAEILFGKPVAEALRQKMILEVEELAKKGVSPTLAILRVGERPDDIGYEKSLTKIADATGVTIKNVLLPLTASQEEVETKLTALNLDKGVHGILTFMPLPKHLDSERIRRMISPEKDVDGCTDSSLAGVFANNGTGFPPCTAAATMEILHHYGIQIEGKKVAVIGRSLVVGRPLAMMLMHENATVVNCHTKTPDVPAVTREADIVISCAGTLRAVKENYLRAGQVVIDVGTNWDEEKQILVGDVDFDSVEPIVSAISPVPGGVGTVTSTILLSHVVESAKRMESTI